MKKILLFCGIFVSTLVAQSDVTQAITAIKSNPKLLDTPQAKIEMQKRGLDKTQVLSQIKTKDQIENNRNKTTFIENNIQEMKTLVEEKENNIIESSYTEKKEAINPLKYVNNEVFLENINKMKNTVVPKNLERYGSAFFNNKNQKDMNSIPTPEYYVLNSSDEVSIWIYGSKNEKFNLKIDKNGNINIPKVGPLKVASKTFGEIKEALLKNLAKVYPNSNVVIDIENYSSIQVNLVGEVNSPGIYNVNSLSTISNLLVTANGVKQRASLREVYLKRDGKVLAVIDFYKLLTDGISSLNIILRSNDTVFVPKAKKIVSVYGEVTSPAKYELKDEETLGRLLSYAGNLKYSASKHGIMIKRYENNQVIKTLEVDISQINNFKLKDGDNIHVYAIDKIHNESFYFYGNIVRPGERELTNKSLHTLLKEEISKKTLKGIFLDKTLFEYALIKRKTENLDYHIENVNLAKVISGVEDFQLQNDDKIYIFNQYNSNIVPYVTIKGEPIVNEGKYTFVDNLRVKDLLQLSGYDPYSKIKVTTYNTKDLLPKTVFVDENFKLSKYDEVEVFDYYLFNKVKTYTIKGQVNLPGKYSMNHDMVLEDAVNIAGGLTEKAYTEKVEVVRYEVINNKRERRILSTTLGDNSFILKNHDEIHFFTIPNWYETKQVTLKGEVNFPGTYSIETGETLSSLIERAGGYTDEAFIEGALFTRESIKNNEKKRLNESMLKLKQQLTFASTNGKELGAKNSSLAEITSIFTILEDQMKNYEAVGRLVIYLDKDINKFKNSSYDIRLEDKDTLVIPSYNDTVSVYGEVLNPGSFVYNKDFSLEKYIELAGGINNKSDSESIYIVLPNGEAKKVNNGYLFNSLNGDEVMAGSTVIVPMEINKASNIVLWKEISQIVYQLAVTAASLSTLGAL